MDFTLLHDNNARSGKIYVELSITRIFLWYRILKNSNTWKLNCHPSTHGNLPINACDRALQEVGNVISKVADVVVIYTALTCTDENV